MSDISSAAVSKSPATRGHPPSPTGQTEAADRAHDLKAETMSARTRVLLDGPIVPTLLRLTAPNVAFIALQPAISLMETYFIGWLGADALAGVALVFPLIMLMQTMSGGGIGGGIASAIARTLGAGRRAEADALALHALVIALGFALAFTTAATLGGPTLYRVMGGTGVALETAITYGAILFGGSGLFWLLNAFGAILRGAGIMLLPAMVSIIGTALTLTVSPALILGVGPVPRLGVAGAAAAFLGYYAIGALVLGAYIVSGRAPIRPDFGARLELRRCREILRVGLPGAVSTVFFNVTVLLLTALVGSFGTNAIAGYGLGARLEYLQIPIGFGIGTALLTMVGTNVGAGLHKRAERIAWTGAALVACISGTIGLATALHPHLWLDMFSTDPEVLDAGTRYLRIVGPVYGLYGAGLALYFASQGAGRVFWPLASGVGRLLVATLGGVLAIHWFGGLDGVYLAMALGLVTLSAGTAIPILFGAWRPRREARLSAAASGEAVADGQAAIFKRGLGARVRRRR